MRKIYSLVYLANIFLSVNGYLNLDWDPKNPAFDSSFYEEFLDAELCQEQLAFVRNNTALALKFIESGIRVPKGISDGNLVDTGNYFQCLAINEDFGTTNIEGKYCKINVPINQNLQIPELEDLIPGISQWIDFDPKKLRVDKSTLEELKKVQNVNAAVAALNGNNVNTRSVEGTTLENMQFSLAVCIPKVCTTQEWINGLILNFSAVGFKYDENNCRVRNDKPWVPADYVAVVVFSLLGLITLLSTSYDVWQSVIMKSDPKQISQIRRSFSLYTNARRLTTFTKTPGALECVDGIRALSITWIIVGHAFSTLPLSRLNMIEAFQWTLSIDSTWVTAAPIGVDTFFTIGGILLVYTTAGKMSGLKLLKNLHLFYLNRILRMTPLLATAVLIQASFIYRLSDGPMYEDAARETDKCRLYWWSTLLYIQNYANTINMCLGHTWYLAIDMQLYILSPIVLFWVLSGKQIVAWIALSCGLMSFLVSSTVYNFIMDFPAGAVTANRPGDGLDYMKYYYLNTWTRASPFVVGMMFGYLLFIWRGKQIILSKFTVLLLWTSAIIMMGLGIFSSHPMKSTDWDNQIVDNMINSFSRPIWAVGIGLVIVACVHRYGGPVDWFLSLQFWKLPSRLSYGMYIFHFPIMYVTAGSTIAPIYFSVSRVMFRFVSELSIAFMVSFVMTLFIDSPFSTIFKLLLGGGPKRPATNETKETNNALPRPVNGLEKGRNMYRL